MSGWLFIKLAIIGLSLTVWAFYYSTEDVVTVQIKGKERVWTTYLVFTDSETFCSSDDPFFWKFDSSDLYGSLEEGKSYDLRVVGWRIPVLSLYRNILSIEPSD